MPESVREIRALVAERVEGREGGIDGKDGTCAATIEDFVVKKLGGEAQRSPSWWDEHTVVRLVVTHLNEHGARELFALPGRGIDLVAEIPEQAERQLAYARERWPEGVYEVREVRFWRDADGGPGNPVHTLVTLVDGDSPQDRSPTCEAGEVAAQAREVVIVVVEGAIQETVFIDDLKDMMAAALVDVIADRVAEQLASQRGVIVGIGKERDNVAEGCQRTAVAVP